MTLYSVVNETENKICILERFKFWFRFDFISCCVYVQVDDGDVSVPVYRLVMVMRVYLCTGW